MNFQKKASLSNTNLDFPKSDLYTLSDLTNPDIWSHWARSGIGGTEVATIAGINRGSNSNKTLLGLYKTKVDTNKDVRKRDKYPPLYQEDRGLALEAPIRRWYARIHKKNDIKVIDGTDIGLSSTSYKYMHAELDGAIIDPTKKTPGILEIKTTVGHGVLHWHDEQGRVVIPDQYRLQLAHYAIVTGWTWGVVVADFNDSDQPQEIPFTSDELPTKRLIDLESSFWNDVQNHVQPDPTSLDIRIMFPKDDGTMNHIQKDTKRSNQLIQYTQQYMDLVHKRSEIQKQINDKQDQLIKEIGGRLGMVLPDGSAVTFKYSSKRNARIFHIYTPNEWKSKQW